MCFLSENLLSWDGDTRKRTSALGSLILCSCAGICFRRCSQRFLKAQLSGPWHQDTEIVLELEGIFCNLHDFFLIVVNRTRDELAPDLRTDLALLLLRLVAKIVFVLVHGDGIIGGGRVFRNADNNGIALDIGFYRHRKYAFLDRGSELGLLGNEVADLFKRLLDLAMVEILELFEVQVKLPEVEGNAGGHVSPPCEADGSVVEDSGDELHGAARNASKARFLREGLGAQAFHAFRDCLVVSFDLGVVIK